MVLEATMICIDNSEWMRNGDYAPSRFQAQADAVNLICGAKTQSNPENTVGVMTMAGKGVRVLVTPTSDLGKILACMHGLEVGAEANLAAAIQVAQLALKHRQNKRQQQRIIAFIGSPVKYDKKVLETIGKKLKKNNVALDIVDFGESDDEKPEKLEALIAAVNSSDSSHIVHVPPGENALSDVLLSTPIFTGEEGGSGFAASAAAAVATGASGFEFGVDPNVDPELALALRLSMEEERARQEAIAKKAAEDTSNTENINASSSNSDSVMAEAELASNAAAGDKQEQPKDDDDLLQQALAMSMEGGASGSAAVTDSAMAEAGAVDPDLALALQMSVQDANMSSDTDMSKVFEDRTFVSSILNSQLSSGEERKAVVMVVAADMPPALQRRAFCCAHDELAAMPHFPRRLEPKRLALALKKLIWKVLRVADPTIGSSSIKRPLVTEATTSMVIRCTCHFLSPFS